MFSISDPVRLGAVGLGRAFSLTARAIAANPYVELVAAAELNENHRQAFVKAFGGRAYADISDLIADADVEAIYISTPHGLHKEHALAAITAGKSVLVEKPMTISLEDASTLIAAAEQMGVRLVVGPSHSFDGPVALASKLIDQGKIGRVRMIHAFYATDFLYRPRTPEELSTELGGGVVFSQAVHQVDVVRRLASASAVRVTARTGGAWDPKRPTEGAYAMLIDFEDEIFASLTYSGYAHFDGDRLMDDVSELGTPKKIQSKSARQTLASVSDEEAVKASRGFVSLDSCPQSETHEHFGQVLVFGDQGDLRLTPRGVEVSDARGRYFVEAPFCTNRAEVFDTLYAAVRGKKAPLQDGKWGRASLEICHALLASNNTGETIELQFQKG
ncbi:Gfo/Idh/MocA family oxidoreductase [Marinobacterium litorale]|uniref:Gfo/Idh/MocA family oxidoreductase n=1 Tax=Marinobacterium litorale TaxID=404770 RepID=UPI000427828E|nr:Gfo/Idh/MocA family oxidoreductase [Marinobacterium litorale]